MLYFVRPPDAPFTALLALTHDLATAGFRRRCIPPFHIHHWLNAYPCRRKLREKLPGVLGWRKSDVRG